MYVSFSYRIHELGAFKAVTILWNGDRKTIIEKCMNKLSFEVCKDPMKSMVPF